MTAKDLPHDRHFERRRKAAKAGLHLPSEEELLRGMPFLGDDIRSDIREYAERLARTVKRRKRLDLAPLAASLDDLAIEQDEDAVQMVEAALAEAAALNVMSTHAARLRCEFYLASYGYPQAAAAIAGETASMALHDVRDCRDFRLVVRALAWAVVANSYSYMQRNGVAQWPLSRIERDLRTYAAEFETAIRQPDAEKKSKDNDPLLAEKWDDVLDEPVERAGGVDGAVVVVRSIRQRHHLRRQAGGQGIPWVAQRGAAVARDAGPCAGASQACSRVPLRRRGDRRHPQAPGRQETRPYSPNHPCRDAGMRQDTPCQAVVRRARDPLRTCPVRRLERQRAWRDGKALVYGRTEPRRHGSPSPPQCRSDHRPRRNREDRHQPPQRQLPRRADRPVREGNLVALVRPLCQIRL